MAVRYSDLPPHIQRQVDARLGAQSSGRRKYNNRITEKKSPTGATLKFDSAKEARRYDQLIALRQAGTVRNLRLQVSYVLAEGYRDPDTGKTIRPITYQADFVYEEPNDDGVWAEVVEDVKGKKTREYELKAKLMRQRGIIIRET